MPKIKSADWPFRYIGTSSAVVMTVGLVPVFMGDTMGDTMGDFIPERIPIFRVGLICLLKKDS